MSQKTKGMLIALLFLALILLPVCYAVFRAMVSTPEKELAMPPAKP
ncbi:MAG: hypothetical protein V4649_04370 [Bacteroidota bacterium]